MLRADIVVVSSLFSGSALRQVEDGQQADSQAVSTAGKAISAITCRTLTSTEAARALSHVAVADGRLVAVMLLVIYKGTVLG